MLESPSPCSRPLGLRRRPRPCGRPLRWRSSPPSRCRLRALLLAWKGRSVSASARAASAGGPPPLAPRQLLLARPPVVAPRIGGRSCASASTMWRSASARDRRGDAARGGNRREQGRRPRPDSLLQRHRPASCPARPAWWRPSTTRCEKCRRCCSVIRIGAHGSWRCSPDGSDHTRAAVRAGGPAPGSPAKTSVSPSSSNTSSGSPRQTAAS